MNAPPYRAVSRGDHLEITLIRWGETNGLDAVHALRGDKLDAAILEPEERDRRYIWDDVLEDRFRTYVRAFVSTWDNPPDMLVFDPARNNQTSEKIEKEEAMPEAKLKTAGELTRLIEEWEADPCWDLGETEGFEEYSSFLYRYERKYKDRRYLEHKARITEFAKACGIEHNQKLTLQLWEMQAETDDLQERVKKLES